MAYSRLFWNGYTIGYQPSLLVSAQNESGIKAQKEVGLAQLRG